MLGLKIRDQFLELGPKTSIAINLINPAFDSESTSRIYTYPFKIKLTSQNQSILDHAHRLDVPDGKVKYKDAELHIQGHLFEKGILEILKTSSKQIEAVFKNQERDLLEDLDQIKINEILETIAIPQGTSASWTFTISTPPDRHTLILEDDPPLIYMSTPGEPLEDIGLWFVDQINALHPGLASFQMPDQLILSEAITIDFGNLEGLTLLSSTNAGEANLQNMQDYLSSLISTPATSHGFPVIRNLFFYGTNNSLYKAYINYWHDGSFLDNTKQVEKIWETSWTPFVKLQYVLTKIIEQTNLTGLDGDWWNIPDSARLTIYNNVALDKALQEEYPEGLRWLNGGKSSFDLNDQVPEMTARELLNAVKELFALYDQIEDDQLLLNKKNSQLQSPPIDWTDKAEPEYQNTKVSRLGLKLDYTDDPGDVAFKSDQLLPYTIADGENEIRTLIGIPYEFTYGDTQHPDYNTWKTLFLAQSGTSDEFENNEYTLRLFFDRHIQQDAQGDDYWMSCHSETDTSGAVIGNYSLDWSGDNGLYETFWKGYAELLSAETVTKVMRLNIQDLLEVRQWKNSRRRIWHPEGDMIGVIRQLQFKATTRGITLSQVEMIKDGS